MTQYSDINGLELYKLCGDDIDNLNHLQKHIKLQDVSIEHLSQIAIQCLKSNDKYQHKIKLLTTKINDNNLDGPII